MRQLGDDQKAILSELQRDAEDSIFPPMNPEQQDEADEEYRRICAEVAEEVRREQENSHALWLEHITDNYDDLSTDQGFQFMPTFGRVVVPKSL